MDLKSEIKEDTVFVMQAKKKRLKNVLLRPRPFDYHKSCLQLKIEKSN